MFRELYISLFSTSVLQVLHSFQSCGAFKIDQVEKGSNYERLPPVLLAHVPFLFESAELAR